LKLSLPSAILHVKGKLMKTHPCYLTRLPLVLKTGAALGAAIFATSALQAGPLGQGPDQSPVYSVEPAAASLSHRAKEFLRDAAQANQTEIAMANVAEARAQNSIVKDLARMMHADHSQNLSQLQAIAQAHGMSDDAAMNEWNHHEVNRLQRTEAEDFDKAYTEAMLKDHVKCIRLFNKAIADIETQDVMQYAQDTVPALYHHLQRSEDAARAAGLDESTISFILKDLPPEDQTVARR
jgi:putative membrane protein